MDVVPNAETGSFGFEIYDGTADPVGAHNACRDEHLDHVEIAYAVQVDNAAGEQFESATRRLQDCYIQLRLTLEELPKKQAESALGECIGEVR